MTRPKEAMKAYSKRVGMACRLRSEVDHKALLSGSAKECRALWRNPEDPDYQRTEAAVCKGR